MLQVASYGIRFLPEETDFVQNAQTCSVQGVQGFLPLVQSEQGVKVTTHPHLGLRLRMSGTIPLISLYAFVEGTGTILHFKHITLPSILIGTAYTV
jgi:hypothetical protein